MRPSAPVLRTLALTFRAVIAAIGVVVIIAAAIVAAAMIVAMVVTRPMIIT